MRDSPGDAACVFLGLWCNGNTADSGPAFPGSSPGSPTERRGSQEIASLFACIRMLRGIRSVR